MRILKLRDGDAALVADEDYADVARFEWRSVVNKGHTYIYRKGRKKNGQFVMLHRYLINPPPGMEVDHINGFGRDNRRVNLRLASKQQNQHNRFASPNFTSKYKGVHRHKGGKWCSSITIAGIQKHLGVFTDEVAAAEAFDDMVRKHRGEFGSVNFPRDGERPAVRIAA